MRKLLSLMVLSVVITGCTGGGTSAPTGKGNVFSVSASSTKAGSSVMQAVDGNPGSTWTPDGTSIDEGLTIRFLKGMKIETLDLVAPGNQGDFEVFFNGVSFGTITPSNPVNVNFSDVYTIYIKLKSDTAKGISEVILNKDSAANAVVYPHQVSGTITASSSLTPEQSYAPDLVVDGRLDFGWAEGASGQGEGESLTIKLQSPQSIDTLYIANGYQRSDDHFEKNSRIKSVEVSLDGQSLGEFTLKDEKGIQTIGLGKSVSAATVSLTIKSVYPGSKYQDTLISEIKLGNKGSILDIQTDFDQRIAKELQSKLAGNFMSSLLGKLFTASNESESYFLKLRRNGSFVLWKLTTSTSYEEDSETTLDNTQVMDGNWVLVSVGDKTVAKIFGRDHTVTVTQARSYNPYSDDSYSSSSEDTRIFSDNLTFEKGKGDQIRISGQTCNEDFIPR